MVALALVLHLATQAPALAPPADPGPFEPPELLASGLGVLASDVLVVGAGYATLQLFAKGVFSPTADGFRNAAFVLAGTALLVPPLTAVLLGRLARASPASGSFWKAFALAAIGHGAALAAAYLAAPQFWVLLPVQLIGVSAGTSVGLHWGPRLRPSLPAATPAAGGAEAPRDAPPVAALAFPICPDA